MKEGKLFYMLRRIKSGKPLKMSSELEIKTKCLQSSRVLQQKCDIAELITALEAD